MTKMLFNSLESTVKKKRINTRRAGLKYSRNRLGRFIFKPVGQREGSICLLVAGEIFEAVRLRTADMAVNAAGIAAVAVFYFVILLVGMFAAWKQRKDGRGSANPEESIMLAKRDLGLFVGVLTMTGKNNSPSLVLIK